MFQLWKTKDDVLIICNNIKAEPVPIGPEEGTP